MSDRHSPSEVQQFLSNLPRAQLAYLMTRGCLFTFRARTAPMPCLLVSDRTSVSTPGTKGHVLGRKWVHVQGLGNGFVLEGLHWNVVLFWSSSFSGLARSENRGINFRKYVQSPWKARMSLVVLKMGKSATTWTLLGSGWMPSELAWWAKTWISWAPYVHFF